FAPLVVPRPLRDVSELVWDFLLLCGCPCASRIMLMATKSRARKNASRTRCVTIVVSSRLFIPSYLLDEFEGFYDFHICRAISASRWDAVEALGEALAWAWVLA